MEAKYYFNQKSHKSLFIIITDNNRLHSIYRYDFYPLFNQYEIKNLLFPANQQLHSQRYYIEKTYDFNTELLNANLQDIFSLGKNLLHKELNYESPDNEQNCATVL